MTTAVIDRSDWVRKCEQNNPQIKELKERLIPLDRAVSFGTQYVNEPANERNKKKARRQDGLLNENAILQLIMQHLEFEGLKESRKLLEKLSKQQYTPHSELAESRLMTILRTILKDTDRVWDLTMDDKFTTSTQNFVELTDHLMDLDLLEEEPPTGVEEVNIWDENLFNLILDRDNKSVKAASLNHLTIKLTETSEEEYDPRLLSTFLHTYRTFTTPEKFLQKLKERYQVPPKDPTGDKKDEEWKPMKRTVQIRVVGVLRKWIAEHYDDFRNSDKLMRELEDFVLLIEKENKALARPLNSALANKENERVIRKDFGKPAPEPKVVLRTIFSPNLDIMECDEEEVARQLTLIEFDTYASIKPPELLGLAWSKPKLKHRAPNVLKMIDRSTKVSNWVATTILKEEKIRKRTRIMFKFIKILEHLFVLNNFSTSMAIIAGLNMAPVYRLKYTFGEIGNHSQRTLEDLGKKLSSTSAYRTYREILATVNPPCIPYLGTYLTDLTFIEEGNPDWYRGLINFNKRRLIYEVLEKIQRYQQTAYNFIQIPQMQEVLETKNLPFLSEDELHRLSVTIEPRNAERAEIQ